VIKFEQTEEKADDDNKQHYSKHVPRRIQETMKDDNKADMKGARDGEIMWGWTNACMHA